MIGAATTISYIVAKEHLAATVGMFITSFTDNKYIFLLIVNISILILGMFIDTSVIQVVFIPIVLPLWPALFTMLVVLVIITYFPDVVLFLPRVFMGYAG